MAASAGIRSGRGGRGEPPAPGGSKAITSRSRMSPRNGCHMSRLAPIPVTSSSGVPLPVRATPQPQTGRAHDERGVQLT